MNKYDILKTRVVMAKSVGINPDDCVIENDKIPGLFAVEYMGYTLVLGFSEVPSICEAREEIKNLYLAGVELEFDEEIKLIK